ncbi:hypothetical protein FE840_001565 [Peteryoungia desertarenae]|uniref:Uncharacterized protein n=1 Tax=Peteryoungia desertarenae TaxID=1813451 RepID=A0ABX6QIF4_9HYPH|nr:hypothetical protein [Peteryoungia desertarenae]QLF68344.1 hypothetical protein FE840_001565 [Peteryoungia desertarenae]
MSRKLALIVGGTLVLCGGTGTAAVFVGAENLLGPSYRTLNGLECTLVQSVETRRKDQLWIRKFITTDEPGDGLDRVKTALRVAKATQAEKNAQLVQVVVLDVNGPKERAAMRGRAIGADVVYVPHPERIPGNAADQPFTVRYVDRAAAPDGQFYGERMSMIEADIEALVAKLDDSTDCLVPEGLLPHKEDSHSTSNDHGKDADHSGEASDSHGEKKDAQPADGEVDGEETPVADAAHGDESKGWVASLMGIVGLGGEDEDKAGADASADVAHAAPDHASVEAVRGSEAPAEEPHETAETAAAPASHEVTPDVADVASNAAEPAETEEQSWFASLRERVLGSDDEDAAVKPVEHETETAESPAVEAQADTTNTDAAPVAAGDATAADAAGAAWLAQFRQAPVGVMPPPDDSVELPPKAETR